jgi:hypothetical protein
MRRRSAWDHTGGIDVQVLSLGGPGLQIQPDTDVAVRDARLADDLLAETVGRQLARHCGVDACEDNLEEFLIRSSRGTRGGSVLNCAPRSRSHPADHPARFRVRLRQSGRPRL